MLPARQGRHGVAADRASLLATWLVCLVTCSAPVALAGALGAEAAAAADPVAVLARSACATVLQARHRLVGSARRRGRRRWRR